MPDPHNLFSALLTKQGMSPALAIAYAKAFRAADTPNKRERIIENLNLSHAMVAVALYAYGTYSEHEGNVA